MLNDKESQRDHQKEGDNIEVIEPPEIADPRQQGHLMRFFGLFGRELKAKVEDFFLAEPEISAADFVGMKFSLLNEPFDALLVGFQETLYFFKGQHAVHGNSVYRTSSIVFRGSQENLKP